ncbi:unnamed protein product [marine sediment metagenome]|uniref:Uncharacterized protein n=1 Tax=marine sediment metagenome TaxID=412755 RepID=X1QIU6_9ZZZZ
MGKGYEKKVKVTRINLDDYLAIKSWAREAGVPMAEALHTIITRDWAMAHKAKPVTKPTFIAKVKAPVALRVRSQPILTTNGHKAGVFVTKPKGGIIND